MSSSSDDEGVIKYRADHTRARLHRVPAHVLRGLIAWRRILFDVGLVGQDPARYGGAGFGNLGARIGPSRFLITGTQTGGVRDLPVDGFSVVTHVEIGRNQVWSLGPIEPSSESMTHASIYACDPSATCVFHVHSPDIWRNAVVLGIPETRAEVPYGTVEMAQEIDRLFRDSAVATGKVLSMAGHEDGVIAFGTTLEEAGTRLLAVLARARAL